MDRPGRASLAAIAETSRQLMVFRPEGGKMGRPRRRHAWPA
jgi:hypothetical protein